MCLFHVYVLYRFVHYPQQNDNLNKNARLDSKTQKESICYGNQRNRYH